MAGRERARRDVDLSGRGGSDLFHAGTVSLKGLVVGRRHAVVIALPGHVAQDRTAVLRGRS